jgi:hypothetical protein
MEKIDRLGWAAGLAFVSHGARIGIRVNTPDVLKRLAALLPPGSVRSTSAVVGDLCSLIVGSNAQDSRVRQYHLVYSGTAQLARTMALEEALEALKDQLDWLVALRSPRKLFVRGAVVAWNGAAIIIPGDRSSETSALVEGLLRAGATSYSDKYAILNERGRVQAYLTPVVESVKIGKSEKQTRTFPPITERTRRSLPIRLIVFPTRQTTTNSRVLSPAQTVVTLLGQTFASRVRPAYALKTLERAVSGATTLELPLDAADAGLAPLLDLWMCRPLEYAPVRQKGDGDVSSRATQQPVGPAHR